MISVKNVLKSFVCCNFSLRLFRSDNCRTLFRIVRWVVFFVLAKLVGKTVSCWNCRTICQLSKKQSLNDWLLFIWTESWVGHWLKTKCSTFCQDNTCLCSSFSFKFFWLKAFSYSFWCICEKCFCSQCVNEVFSVRKQLLEGYF